MMADLAAVFASGRVRRWHTNLDLSCTEDYNDAHQGRVARIILALHPDPSAGLICAALTHDDGERGPGDLSTDAKKNPELRAIVEAEERKTAVKTWGKIWWLESDEQKWLKFADRLDAYMWAKHKAPWVLVQDTWVKHRRELLDSVESLGCTAKIKGII